MRAVALRVVLVIVSGLVACMKHNPAVCCTSPSDCNSIGAMGETERSCEGEFVCINHECTTAPDAAVSTSCSGEADCSGQRHIAHLTVLASSACHRINAQQKNQFATKTHGRVLRASEMTIVQAPCAIAPSVHARARWMCCMSRQAARRSPRARARSRARFPGPSCWPMPLERTLKWRRVRIRARWTSPSA